MAAVIDIISQLRNLNGSFPKREQRVADYVLTNLENIAYLRQAEIAEAADVSVATVNRFCVTLGCEGFQDFKRTSPSACNTWVIRRERHPKRIKLWGRSSGHWSIP